MTDAIWPVAADASSGQQAFPLTAGQAADDRRVGVDGTRPSDEMTLNLVALLAGENGELVGGLDPFGQNRDAQSVGEPDDRPDDGERTVAAPEMRNERAIDLDAIERKLLQIRQR